MCGTSPWSTIHPMQITNSKPTLLRRLRGPVQALPDAAPAVTIRQAAPADTGALDRLAALDSQRAPRGVVLLAEVDDRIWAAISIDDGHAVADPFHPTGELVALLVERARQLRRGGRGRLAGATRVWPTAGHDRPALS
jgi:hypothetical protein